MASDFSQTPGNPDSSDGSGTAPQSETAYRSPLLAQPGAAEARDADSQPGTRGVAWHYGDPLTEQRVIDSGTAVIDRSNRRVIRIDGPDAAVFLNNLLSQKLIDTADGFSARALDLNIQGHILHSMEITRAGDTYFVDTSDEEFDSLFKYLTMMIFWSDVTVTEADLGLLTIVGKHVELPSDLPTAFTRQVDWGGPERIDVAVPRSDLPSTVQELSARGAQLIGLMAYTAERVKAREPEARIDLDEKAIPHEVPSWIGRGAHLGAVHLDKGCYRGQETVARVENLGRSPRVMVMLHLDGSAPELPEPGAIISLGGRRVGRVGTVVHDHELGPIALGLIKRSALGGDAPLTVNDAAVAVDTDSIVDDEGERRGRAAIEKLRSRD